MYVHNGIVSIVCYFLFVCSLINYSTRRSVSTGRIILPVVSFRIYIVLRELVIRELKFTSLKDDSKS